MMFPGTESLADYMRSKHKDYLIKLGQVLKKELSHLTQLNKLSMILIRFSRERFAIDYYYKNNQKQKVGEYKI